MPPSPSLPELAPLAAVLTLLELGAGAAVVAWLIDVIGGVGRGFRGTTAAICAVIVAVALLICSSLPDPHAIVAGGNAATFSGAIHWVVALTVLLVVDVFFAAVGTNGARHVVGAVTAGVGVVSLVTMALAFAPTAGPTGAIAALITVLPAGLLSGAALAGMLLGHWYLVAPDLTFRPLRQAVYIVFATVGLEAVAAAVGLFSASGAARGVVVAGADAILFWLLVVGSGIVFTAAVNGLTLYFARIRANQPATAMLYVLIITVLMGVVPGSLVLLQTGAGV